MGNTDYGTHPVGTGPWQVSPRSTPGSNMVYTAFDRYWEASSVRVPVVNVRVGSESTFVASLSGNSAQAVMLTGAPTDAKTLRANGLPVKDSGTTYLHLLYLNKSGALADPRVRQAISLAIDRKAICEALLAGACTPTAQPLQPKSWAYDKSTPAPTRNVDKAKALLAEAGQSKLTFKTVVSSAGTQLQTELSAIQQMLGDVGITMTVSPMPVVQLLPSLANGTAQAYYSVNTGGADPAIPIITMTAPAYNPGGYSEPGLKTAFEQANRAVSQQDRAVAYQKVSRQYQETAYNVVVLNQDLRFATAKAVQGVIGRDPLVIDARGVVVP